METSKFSWGTLLIGVGIGLAVGAGGTVAFYMLTEPEPGEAKKLPPPVKA